MVAGINNKEPMLYTSDITGNYFSYYANAIGENDEKLREKLRETYKQDLTISKGVKIALEMFKEIQGKNFDIDRFELGYIENQEGKLKKLEGEEIKEL